MSVNFKTEQNAHVRTMQMLRRKYNDMPGDRSWLANILSKDYDSQVIHLRKKKYDLQLLVERGFSSLDFLSEGMSWMKLSQLGYTLRDAHTLGFTTDQLCACGVRVDDLLSERKYVLSTKSKELVQRVCQTKQAIVQFLPAELFRLGYRREELISQYGFSNEELVENGMIQYFSSSTPQPTALEAIAGPHSAADLPRLRINMKNLM